jgi:hypothetical protein
MATDVWKYTLSFLQFQLLEKKQLVKPVYKNHTREPENVSFIYRLKSYALFINGENETAFYRQWFVIQVSFKAGLTVDSYNPVFNVSLFR